MSVVVFLVIVAIAIVGIAVILNHFSEPKFDDSGLGYTDDEHLEGPSYHI